MRVRVYGGVEVTKAANDLWKMGEHPWCCGHEGKIVGFCVVAPKTACYVKFNGKCGDLNKCLIKGLTAYVHVKQCRLIPPRPARRKEARA
jgi:hypothetical protein